MSNNNNKVSSGGVGFTGLLTIVFTVLKLTKVINWSWWWVLSPVWIYFILIILIAVVCVGLEEHSKKRVHHKKHKNKKLKTRSKDMKKSIFRNDKVALLKEYEVLKQVGEIYEVANITTDMVVLRDRITKIAVGAIKIEDFDKYFEKVEN